MRISSKNTVVFPLVSCDIASEATSDLRVGGSNPSGRAKIAGKLLTVKFVLVKHMVQAHKHVEVVAGLIFRDGRLLACQRHESGTFPLKWEFPGGKVEVGESDVDALRRELREELGIDVREAEQIFQHRHVYPDGPEVWLRFFRILSHDGEMQNLVFQRIEWVELLELEQLEFLAGDRPLIRRLLADRTAGLLSQ